MVVVDPLALLYLQVEAVVLKVKKAAANPDLLLHQLVPAADVLVVLKAAVLPG